MAAPSQKPRGVAVLLPDVPNAELPDVPNAELDLARAERDAALDQLQGVVRYVRRVGGFMRSTDQLTMRNAEALLVASGRGVER